MRIQSALLVLLFLITTSGCGNPTVNDDSIHERHSGVVQVPTHPLTVSDNPKLVVYEADEEGFQIPGDREFTFGDIAEMEERVRAVDWNRKQDGAEVILVHDDKNNIRAYGSFGAESEEEKIVMALVYENSGTYYSLIATEIENVDQMISIFNSYYSGTGDWRTEVTWFVE